MSDNGTLDLKAIRELCDDATAGPWIAQDGGNGLGQYVSRTDRPLAVCYVYPFAASEWAGAEDDAAFIAHARSLVPALVDEVERLRAEVVKYGDHLPGCKLDWDWDTPCSCGFADFSPSRDGSP